MQKLMDQDPLSAEQREKINTFRELSAAFIALLAAEESEADAEATEAMNSLATSEEDLQLKAGELTDMNVCLTQARLRMQEAVMWAARAVRRESGEC